MRSLAQALRKTERYKNAAGPVEWPLPDQLIGIEVEVEGRNWSRSETNLFPYWNRTTDGSLQNGVEFVLAQPLSGNNLSVAIHQFFSQVQPVRATTSGTHVHIDMMEDNVNVSTIQCLILLMYILESGVYAYADPSREWCGFTNRLTTAPVSFIHSLLRPDLIDNDADLLATCQGDHGTGKYYGLNLLALANYGSVEFRYFPTATSPDELISWIKLVQSFKKAAMFLGVPTTLETIVATESNYIDFIATHFNEWQEMFLKHVSWKAARNNYHKAMAIPQSVQESGKLRCIIKQESILKNKRFAKLLKMAKKEHLANLADITISVCITDSRARGGPLPNARENPGMFLCYNSDWHVSYRHNWCAFDERSQVELETIAGMDIFRLRNKLLEALAESNLLPSTQAAAAEYLHRRIGRILDYNQAQQMPQSVDSEYGDYAEEVDQGWGEGELVSVPEEVPGTWVSAGLTVNPALSARHINDSASHVLDTQTYTRVFMATPPPVWADEYVDLTQQASNGEEF